jgi:signal transduction histidine kinase
MSSAPALAKWRARSRLHKEDASDVRELWRLIAEQREELRHAKHELLESRTLAMIGTMVQSISHDLRHHLSAVYAGAEFMSSEKVLPPDREALMEEVGMAIHTMTGLLDSLLLFAETGRALHPRPGSVNLLVERALAMVRAHPDALEVETVVKDMPSIAGWMDCKRLGSAVYNLLLNACQAARRGLSPKRVEIDLSQDPSLIHLRITDSGPGVPDCIRETLFQPFVSHGHGNGIGLGLTIAERGAREHGGLLCLEESRPGRTIFALHLSKLALRSPVDAI